MCARRSGGGAVAATFTVDFAEHRFEAIQVFASCGPKIVNSIIGRPCSDRSRVLKVELVETTVKGVVISELVKREVNRRGRWVVLLEVRLVVSEVFPVDDRLLRVAGGDVKGGGVDIVVRPMGTEGRVKVVLGSTDG